MKILLDSEESIDYALFLNGYIQGALTQLKEHCKIQAELVNILFKKLNTQKEILENLVVEQESGKDK